MGGVQLDPEVARGLREIAARQGIARVRVFGSFARGEATSESDLDLLVQLGPREPFRAFMAFCREAEALTGRRVDVLAEDGLSPFLRERVLAEAIPL